MEKKTTRRLIGVLVVVALIIILLPLMFNGNGNDAQQVPTQTADANSDANKQVPTETMTADNSTANTPTSASINQPEVAANTNETSNPATVASNSADAPAAAINAATTAAPATNAVTTEATTASATINDAPKQTAPEKVADASKQAPVTNSTSKATDSAQVPVTTHGPVSKADTKTPLKAKAAKQTVAQVKKPVVALPSDDADVDDAAPAAKATVAKTSAGDFDIGTDGAVNASKTQQVAAADNDSIDITDGVETNPVVKAAPIKVAPKVTAKNTVQQPAVAAVAPKKDHNTVKTLAAADQKGWVIQMGSFRNQDNVKKMMSQLTSHGYHPFTYETKSNGQTRIYVGPQFQRDEAVAMVQKIQHDVNLRGVVIIYKPTTA